MERYFGPSQAAAARREGVARVATIGFFDGVHRGHARVISQLTAWAAECAAEPVIVTFDRHPQSIFGGHPPVPVVSLEHRLLLLERAGIRATLVLEFDRELATWEPERFVRDVLRGALGARRLLLGYDGAFGRGRSGTFEYLEPRSAALGLELRRVEELGEGGETISSTRIRSLLREASLDSAARLLGRPFSLVGRVVSGFGRGRELGFPTANLDIGHAFLLPRGVYDVSARLLGKDLADAEPGTMYAAVMNVGRAPTFDAADDSSGEAFDPARDRVEVHLIDFDGDLYGDYLEVEVHARRRGEERFDSVDALKRQIRNDVAARRRLEE